MLTGRAEAGFFWGPAFESLPGRKFPPGSADCIYQRTPIVSLRVRGTVYMFPVVFAVTIGMNTPFEPQLVLKSERFLKLNAFRRSRRMYKVTPAVRSKSLFAAKSTSRTPKILPPAMKRPVPGVSALAGMHIGPP